MYFRVGANTFPQTPKQVNKWNSLLKKRERERMSKEKFLKYQEMEDRNKLGRPGEIEKEDAKD